MNIFSIARGTSWLPSPAGGVVGISVGTSTADGTTLAFGEWLLPAGTQGRGVGRAANPMRGVAPWLRLLRQPGHNLPHPRPLSRLQARGDREETSACT